VADPRIAAAMARLIGVREELMVDEGTITRPGDLGPTPELDPDTGLPVNPAAEPVYTGMPCTISDPSSALVGNRTVVDDGGVPNRRILKTPHRYDLRPGDLLTVTLASVSPGLVGDVFTIVGEEERSYATYRRFVIRGAS
jgi:hypothetical protein